MSASPMPTSRHFREFPHPLLDSRSPTLYARSVPFGVVWRHFAEIFKKCGPIPSANVVRGRVSGADAREGGLRTWAIHFAGVLDAEKALATMNGLTVKAHGSEWRLLLSHAPMHAPPHPPERTYPLFLWSAIHNPPHPLMATFSAQTLFTIFRFAGPLVSVRVGVDVGLEQTTAVLEFWHAEHAEYAQRLGRDLDKALLKLRPFHLRRYDPCAIVCSNLPADIQRVSVEGMFSKYGQVERIYLSAGSLFFGSAVYVIYHSRDMAASALRNVRRDIGDDTLSVRYLYPDEDHPKDSEYIEQVTGQKTGSDDTDESDGYETPDEGDEEQTEDVAAASLSQRAQSAQCRCEEAQRLFDEAERAAKEATQRHEEAVRMQTGTAHAHMHATLSKRSAENELKSLTAACEMAKKKFYAMMDEADRAKRHLESIHVSALRAQKADEAATAESAKARHEELRLSTLKQEAERELREAQAAKEAIHYEELAGLKQKMEAINLREAADRPQREARAHEERLREEQIAADRARTRAEAQKLLDEQRQNAVEAAERCRQEQERSEKAQRQAAYGEAYRHERDRCMLRNEELWPLGYPADMDKCLLWYDTAGSEFDALHFSLTLPLTFESIPWPVLRRECRHHRMQDITWAAVDEFFIRLRRHYRGLHPESDIGEGVYLSALQTAQRRFHSDRWSSRNLLATVLDDNLKQELSRAGTCVAQAVSNLLTTARQQQG